MSTPKMPKAQPLRQEAIEIDDATVVGAKDEAVRRAKGRGYLGTVLTGFKNMNAGALKTVLG